SLSTPSGERRLTRQHLVQDAAQAVEIASAVELLLARRLLRAHVGRGAHRDPRFSEPLPTGYRDRAPDPEVADDRMARLEQNVLRLDIPVHDPKPVRVAQGISDLACDPQGVVEVELFLTGQTLAQGFALDVGHHVVQQSSSLTG